MDPVKQLLGLYAPDSFKLVDNPIDKLKVRRRRQRDVPDDDGSILLG
jgi:hypothetical protein